MTDDKDYFKKVVRGINETTLGEKRAEWRVGGYKGYYDSARSKCFICGCEIWFLNKKEEDADLLKEDVKDVCIKCCLASEKELPPKIREIFETVQERHEREIKNGQESKGNIS